MDIAYLDNVGVMREDPDALLLCWNVQMSKVSFHIKMSIVKCNKSSVCQSFFPHRHHTVETSHPDQYKEERKTSQILLKGESPEIMLRYFTFIKSTALRLLPQLYVLVRWKGTTVKH